MIIRIYNNDHKILQELRVRTLKRAHRIVSKLRAYGVNVRLIGTM